MTVQRFDIIADLYVTQKAIHTKEHPEYNNPSCSINKIIYGYNPTNNSPKPSHQTPRSPRNTVYP